MPEYKTTAITLKTYDFKDFDKIVVLYSQDKGLVRTIAKGVKKPKSSIGPRVEPLNAINIILNEGRNLHVVKQCDFVNTFKPIKADLRKLTLGFFFLELVLCFAMENDPNASKIYDLLFNSLKSLENIDSDIDINAILVDFEYKLITLAGYSPWFNNCSRCNIALDNNSDIFIDQSYDLEYLTCVDCSISVPDSIPLDKDIYLFLTNLKDDSVTSVNLDACKLLTAHNILFRHISSKAGCKLKTPKLLETLCLG